MKSLLALLARLFRPSDRAIRARAGWPDHYNRVLVLFVGAALLSGCLPRQSHAADKPGQTVAQCLSLLQALRNLDGHIVVVKQNGADTPVMVPWDFGSGALRMKIGTSVAALALFETTLETTRQNIVKEILKKMSVGADGVPPTEIKAGTPEFAEYQKQYTEALGAPCTVNLPKIKASELKLEKNEIPVTAIAALASMIDDDVSGK